MADDLNTDDRKKMAASGVAMSDGSFPIPNKQYLAKAIMSIGRADPSRRAAVKAHIKKRAKALNAENMLPSSWK